NAVKNSTSLSLSSLSISKMAFDPQNRQTVFAGSYTDGLYRSDDGGAAWSKILSKILVYDFVINPLDSKIIYASGYFGDHGLVLKTTDGGASWVQIYKEESTLNAARSIALNPLNPNQLVIGTTSGGVIKSADAGNTWQLAKDFKDRVNRVLWQNGNVYVLLKTKGLFKSSGFADNFTEITLSLAKFFSFDTLSYNSANIVSSFNQVYVDVTTPSLIYLTSDKGLYKTTDEGVTWVLQNLPIKPDQADGRAVAVSRSSSNIVYTSVGSTIYKSTDGGGAWQTQNVTSGGFVNYILVDPELPQIVYAGIYSTK
ncbi:MAG TPA: YCF48-related protein, partial [Candidatus Limnocylindria bacterium]|nr:YCF48-related protein [Candidatus Limnocylindria bacterium]